MRRVTNRAVRQRFFPREPRPRGARGQVILGLALGVGSLLSAVGAGASTATVDAAGTFPVSVTAGNGTVRIATRPERIISLSPSATNMLFAIGAGRQVVAVDNDSTYPASAPRTDLSGVTPNLEAIAKYRPDLVVISYNPNGLVADLGRLGIPVLWDDAPTSISGTYGQIEQLGTATGHLQTSERVVTSMRNSIRTLVSSTPRYSPALRYYYELDQDYYSATSSTFIGAVLSEFGLRDIADAAAGASSGYPQLSAEYIVKANPQVVFLADTICCGQSAKTVAARPGWSSISAVRSGAVVTLNDSIASQWGPRIVALFTDVHDALVRLEDKRAA